MGDFAGGAQAFGLQCPGQQAVAPRSGEDDQPVMSRFEGRERQPRVETLGAEMRFGEQPAEIRVALCCFGKQNQMTAIGECDFRTGDCLQAEWLRGMCEREGAVDAVLVGERQGGIAQAVRFREELVGRGGAVEEGIGGVAVKFCVHWILAVKKQMRRSCRSKNNCGGRGGQAVCMNHSWVTISSKRTTREPPSSITAKYRRDMSCLHHSSSMRHISRTASTTAAVSS